MSREIVLTNGRTSLRFEVENGLVYLTDFFGKELHYDRKKKVNHTYLSLFDDCKEGDYSDRNITLGEKFFYESHTQEKTGYSTLLRIVERNEKFRVESVYELFDAFPIVNTYKTVENIFSETAYIENCASFLAYGIAHAGTKMELYRPFNSNYNECQWTKVNLADEGITELKKNTAGYRRVFAANAGSQSSKTYIPMGMLCGEEGYLAWQIMSDSVWHYEAGLSAGGLYLNVGGGAYSSSGYIRSLSAGESYQTVAVQLTLGNSLDEVTAAFTDYRRLLRKDLKKATNAIIFNEYMHCSWDSPCEERTLELAEKVAKMGAEYYVIDACWHDETCDSSTTHMIGGWKESKTRFPSGLKNTLDKIKSFGLKTGLWIEIQSVGVKCPEIPLPDECFFTFKGKKTAKNRRYHLDFRHPKVVEWANETVDRVLNEYEIDYLKIDYNQYSYGTDYRSTSMAEALEEHSKSYIAWLKALVARHPKVVFESCASGGQSINPLNLSACDLMSTSDQTGNKEYAYISVNIGSAILPEQAAVWCYPLDYWKTEETTTVGDTVINMVNPAFHRIHFASRFDKLSQKHQEIIQEGLAYYRTLSAIREKAYPIFPCGFAKAGDEVLVGGLRNGNDLYLSVYKFSEEEREILIDLSAYGQGEAKVGFPASFSTPLSVDGSLLKLRLEKGATARIIEYRIKK